MAAADHLSPRLFHSTDSDLSPGDLIHPGYRIPNESYHASDDYNHIGHGDFAWAAAGRPKASFGRKHYEVEPTGLAHPYEMHEHPNGISARKSDPGSTPRYPVENIHKNNWVSLAPLRVKGRVNGRGKPYEDKK
jgi:hypothetical protein